MTVEREPDQAQDAVHCVWSEAGFIRRDHLPRRTLDKVETWPWHAANKTGSPRKKGWCFAC